MNVGDLVQMKSPSSKYSWRKGAGVGMGIVLKGTRRQENTMRGVTIYWFNHHPIYQSPDPVQNIVEDWLEVLE